MTPGEIIGAVAPVAGALGSIAGLVGAIIAARKASQAATSSKQAVTATAEIKAILVQQTQNQRQVQQVSINLGTRGEAKSGELIDLSEGPPAGV